MPTKKVFPCVVLSVSLGKGCYRHIRVPANWTLEQLADVILWAFGFDNDHAHAFFMDNRAWSRDNCFYMAEVDEDEEYRHTRDYSIDQLNLMKGDAFKFVFDFGEGWEFQCKLLRVENADAKTAELLRVVGAAPKQYPGYDDDDE